MTEIDIEVTCFDCELDNEVDDCIECNECEQQICESCQSDHAIKHCFEKHGDLKKLLEEGHKRRK